MANYIEKNTYYYLRSLPIFAATLVYFIMLRVHPDFVAQLNSYIVDSNPEEGFSEYGWSLYNLIIPFCIAGLSRYKSHWLMILALLAYPIALSISYWLWELLGWAVMGAMLFGFVAFSFVDDRTDTSHNIYVGVVCTACALYAIIRILSTFGSGSLRGIADVGLVVLIGGYFVISAIVDVFKWENGYDSTVYPSGITMLYIFVLSIALLIMGGSDAWIGSALTGKDRKKYNDLIHNAQYAQNEGNYRYAANYYTQAAALHSQKDNESLAAQMTYKADSVEGALQRKIPQDLKALQKQKRNSSTFNELASSIEHEITMLEKNASKATAQTTIDDYKKRLDKQLKRKK